jgi:hypothetical protein
MSKPAIQAMKLAKLQMSGTHPIFAMAAPAQSRTFRMGIRAPKTCDSLSMICPVSPSQTGRFGKEQSGTGFGKRGSLDGPGWICSRDCPAAGSFLG